ncbi:MAG: DUF4337 domain-containing protein [SAR202 cluster bacterium]|nr:DUF4337 domain-containing protein [SAR202 cluster bacterium]
MPTVSTPLRRWFLTALIGSLVISALIAIFILIFGGDFGETEGKILFTTLTISLFSLTGLGSAAPLERSRLSAFWYLGIALAVVGFVFFVIGIWSEWVEKEHYGNSMGTIAIFSFSFAQVGMLSLVRLKGTARVLTPVTAIIIFILASMVSAMMFVDNIDDGEYLRAVGVLAVLDALGTVTIPLLGRMTPRETPAAAPSQVKQVELRCPRCGTMQTMDEGGALCQKCALRITIRTEA